MAQICRPDHCRQCPFNGVKRYPRHSVLGPIDRDCTAAFIWRARAAGHYLIRPLLWQPPEGAPLPTPAAGLLLAGTRVDHRWKCPFMRGEAAMRPTRCEGRL